jgi:ABC-type multidrug transport system ATPase subunit
LRRSAIQLALRRLDRDEIREYVRVATGERPLEQNVTELAQDRIVLLSTHIVEDVAVLCPRFAVIRGGRLVAETTPGAAREALAGQIFEGTASPEEMAGLRARQRVTQAVLVEGRHRVRVHEPEGAPPPGFESAAPTLEDAYLLMMAGA